MIDTDKAIAFVHQRGNRLDRLRLRRALGDPLTLAEAKEVLAPYQFSDGSWDYDAQEEQVERIGSLGGTIHCLRWLREFGLGSRSQMVRTLEFLALIQAPGGSFYETEVKKPPWNYEEILLVPLSPELLDKMEDLQAELEQYNQMVTDLNSQG